MTQSIEERARELRERLDKSFNKVVDLETRTQILNCIMPVVTQVQAEARTERRELLQTSLQGLRVLRAIGQSRAYKTVGKVEVPSWGKPVMETCDQLISEIEEYFLRTTRVIQSDAAQAAHPTPKETK